MSFIVTTEAAQAVQGTEPMMALQRALGPHPTCTQAQFWRIIIKHLGLAADASVPHTHCCGLGAKRVLTAATVSHLKVRPMLSRGTATHSAIRDTLARMVELFGLADAGMVKTPVSAADGDTTMWSTWREASSCIVLSCHNGIRHFTGPNLASR
jgi:hypothetical protein